MYFLTFSRQGPTWAVIYFEGHSVAMRLSDTVLVQVGYKHDVYCLGISTAVHCVTLRLSLPSSLIAYGTAAQMVHCFHDSCNKKSSFNSPGYTNPAYCKEHDNDGMFEVLPREAGFSSFLHETPNIQHERIKNWRVLQTACRGRHGEHSRQPFYP